MQALRQTNLQPAPKKNAAQTWEENHLKIEELVETALKQGKRMTQTKIGVELNLSRFTVGKHLKERSLNKASKQSAKILNILKPTIDLGIAKKALEGDPRAIKQFYKII